MSTIPLLSSSPTYSEASQIIGTVNSVIQQINANALIGSQAPTSYRNLVIGGDFSTNPWQRATSFTSITNTLTYTADRFWALGAAGSSISVSQQAETGLPGFSYVARFGRASSNADTNAIKFGQVFTTERSYGMQGTPFVLSFWAKKGADYSPASGVLGVAVAYGTGTNESASAYAGGTWTGQTSVTLTGSAGTTVTGVTLTTSYQRFVVSGFIPITATQVGFNFSMTPVGTASTADYVQFAGIQFEKVPQGGVTPTPFEYQNAADVRLNCMRFYQQINEPATGAYIAQGSTLATTTASIPLPLPVPMRTTPTATGSSGTTLAAGGWALKAATGTLTATISATIQVNGISSVQLNVNANGATLTAASPVQLTGAGLTTAPIQLSAEL